MATTTKGIYTGHDFQKTGIIKDARINPLSSGARATLASSLGAGHVGLLTTDDTTGLLYTWNGTAFVFAVTASQSGLTPKGNIHFNDTEPSSPTIGDLYVFDTAGTNTWNTSDVMQIGDQAYWDGTIWQFIQGNTIQGTSSVQGILQLATSAEVITGSDTAKATTSAGVSAREASRKVARVYFISGVSLVADTPLTVNHALGLQNRNAFTYNVMVSNSAADVDCDSTDTNNLTLTSNISVTADVTVIGF